MAVWSRDHSGSDGKKVVKPSARREMAQKAVATSRATIRLACCAFSISETCYRYESKLSSENEVIADWLIRLTQNQVNWGLIEGRKNN